jgi:uncharacterized membrane protein
MRFSGERQYVEFPGSSTYPAYSYAVPALAITLGRAANLTHLRTFHLARLLNAILGVTLCAAAIAVTPVGAWGVAGVCLLPMFLAQTASVSSDVPIFGFSLLACALLTREAVHHKEVEEAEPGAKQAGKPSHLFAAATLIALSGAIRAPMVGLIVPLAAVAWFAVGGSRRRRATWAALLPLAVLAAVVAWTNFAMTGQVDPRLAEQGHVNAGEQVEFLLNDPSYVFTLALATLDHHGTFYWNSMIGMLGWLDAPLEGWFYVLSSLVLVTLAGLVALDCRAAPAWFAWSSAAGVLLTTSLIFAALYVGWTSVGRPVIMGVQGRYLLPLVALLFLIVAGRARTLATRFTACATGKPTSRATRLIDRAAHATLCLYALASLGHVPWVLVRRYYLG